ncbi:hypothetical protein IWW47_001792 [Coemansia sp. RSA 2052]|nr:hypothetical protein IWW47_001792 [Coemansia sp. RSA 2052]
MLWSRNNRDTPTDVAFINSGGIRAGISPGPTRVKDVLLVFPFGNAVVSLDIIGKRLKQIIAGVVQKTNLVNGRPVTGFIQLAGARIKYHSTSNSTSVLGSIEIAQEGSSSGTFMPLDETKTYRVATLDYVARGGDNIIDPPIDAPALLGLDVVVEDYFRQFSPITPKLSRRIINS